MACCVFFPTRGSDIWAFIATRKQLEFSISYYQKLPPDIAATEVLLIDPMLATGGSGIAAVDCLKKAGVSGMRFVCLVAAPGGESRRFIHIIRKFPFIAPRSIGSSTSAATSYRGWVMRATEFSERKRVLAQKRKRASTWLALSLATLPKAYR